MLRPHGLRTLGYVSLSLPPIEARDPEQPAQAPIDAPHASPPWPRKPFLLR
jgi:hypothetical protein